MTDAMIRSATFNADAMTVEAIISTFADVPRRAGSTSYVERLDPAGLDQSRIIGRPVLDGHRQQSGRDVIGAVQSYRLAPEGLVAVLRLSTGDDVAPIVEKIKQGFLKDVSIGYRVREWRESRSPETGERIRTAVSWSIDEVSVVPIGADASAQIRSLPMEDTTNQNNMADADIQRIRSVAELAKLPESWALDQIAGNATFEESLAAARTEVAKRNEPSRQIRAAVGVDHTDPAVIQTRAADALSFAMSGGELPEASRPYVGMSFLDMARDSLQRAGISCRGLSVDETFQRASHGTSDFPIVVSNAANKSLLGAYRAAESPLKTLGRQRNLPNFKESTALRLGGMGRLEELSEHGEITATSRGENGEKMSLKTFARRFDLSRKLLIDDDKGAFGDITAALGTAAAQTEADLLVSLIVDNPAMSDGTSVFATARGNLTNPGTLDEAGLSDARLALRQRKDLDGVTLISATPRYLLVGPEIETDAEKLLATIQATTTSDVNPFGGKLQLLVEPRLAGNDFYVFADPGRLPGFAYGYLSGQPGPQIQRREEWSTLGLSFRCFEDFGAGWIDWRAAQMVVVA